MMSSETWRQFLRRGGALALTLGISGFLLCAFIVYEQERMIFPGLAIPPSDGRFALLEGVRALRFKTVDGETLQAFTTIVEGETPAFVGLIFHGNGETAESQNFLPFFRKVGIPALTFDYRGFRDSTGWPTEEGLYRDADAAAEEVRRLTGLPYSQFVLLGNSLGGGPASYLAQKIQPRALVLLATFTSLRDVVSGMGFPYRILTPWLRFEFPVAQNLSRMSPFCVVLAHGERDEVIPFEHFNRIRSGLEGWPSVTALSSKEASHNDLFYKVESELVVATRRCLS